MEIATALSWAVCPGSLPNGRPCRRKVFRFAVVTPGDSSVYVEMVCPKCGAIIGMWPGSSDPQVVDGKALR